MTIDCNRSEGSTVADVAAVVATVVVVGSVVVVFLQTLNIHR